MFTQLRSSCLAAVLCLALGACAGTEAGQGAHETATDDVVATPVSVGALGASLGLAKRPEPGRSHVVLGMGDEGRRIILFPGSTTAVVRGRKVVLDEAVEERHGTAFVSAADASRIRSAWKSSAPRTETVGDALPPPPPRTQPSVVIDRPRPARTARYSNAPSVAERRAWTVPLKRDWRYIVIHHSASPTGSADSFHRAHLDRGWDGLGYDFVIGNGRGSGDGEIEVGYRWVQQKVGAHAGNDLMNQHGIGVCLVGDFTESPPTRSQMAALQRLCDFLADYCDIPDQNLRLHRDVRQTKCPGPLFPTSFRLGRPASGAALSVR